MIINLNSGSRLDYQDLPHVGLLLIKIGTIVTFITPLAIVLALVLLPMPNPLSFAPEFLSYIFAGFIILGFALGIISALFYKDIMNGNSKRITHALVLGIVIFFLGSNVGGLLIAVGAYLCQSSSTKRLR